jgi:hypothetical protein
MRFDAVLAALAQDSDIATPGQLARALEDRAETQTEWLVRVAVSNIEVPPRAVEVADGVLLVPSSSEKTREVDGQVRQYFGESFGPLFRLDEADGREFDTRVGAELLMRARGELDMVRHRAVAQAGYALAVWCLLCPPDEQVVGQEPRGFVLWPAVASWVPQPFQHDEPRAKPHEPATPLMRRTQAKGPSMVYGEYRLPDLEPLLRAPFAALDKAPHSLCATALLSAAWHLYLAMRIPGDLPRADRIVHLMSAREALMGGADTVERWDRVAERFAVWDELELLGFPRDRVAAAAGAAWDVRNITAHGHDSCLINLGLPPDRRTMRRGHIRESHELAPLTIAGYLSPLLTAVAGAARRLFVSSAHCDFDAQQYLSWLNGPTTGSGVASR